METLLPVPVITVANTVIDNKGPMPMQRAYSLFKEMNNENLE